MSLRYLKTVLLHNIKFDNPHRGDHSKMTQPRGGGGWSAKLVKNGGKGGGVRTGGDVTTQIFFHLNISF